MGEGEEERGVNENMELGEKDLGGIEGGWEDLSEFFKGYKNTHKIYLMARFYT